MSSFSEANFDVYTQNASAFDQERGKSLFERDWLDRFGANLPSNGTVLDIGCGTGRPIAQYFIEQGYKLTGIDFAAPMIEIAQRRFPNATWLCHDMTDLKLGERKFNGIIAWHSFFHLTQDEQRRALPAILGYLKTGGVFMTTVGPDAGEAKGYVNEQAVYHASLSKDEYESLLNKAGLSLTHFIIEDQSCGGATVLLAQKRG